MGTNDPHKQKTMVTVFGDHLLSGLVLWAFCMQYYVVQLVAALAWKLPNYSLTRNTISDLGNTACGTYGTRVVCSPLHVAMNISFVALGILMAGGALLLYSGMQKSTISLIGFCCIAIAGFGTMLVGLFPENTVSDLHIAGAALPFVIGNIGLLFFGCWAHIPKPLRISALTFGVISLLALALFMTHHYVGIGIGGVERIVVYPQTIWLILFALYMFRTRYFMARNAHSGI